MHSFFGGYWSYQISSFLSGRISGTHDSLSPPLRAYSAIWISIRHSLNPTPGLRKLCETQDQGVLTAPHFSSFSHVSSPRLLLGPSAFTPAAAITLTPPPSAAELPTPPTTDLPSQQHPRRCNYKEGSSKGPGKLYGHLQRAVRIETRQEYAEQCIKRKRAKAKARGMQHVCERRRDAWDAWEVNGAQRSRGRRSTSGKRDV
ncbi:hypothetical protein B0H11DRAFT_2194927 [Mycena galericulata]|nr:hypothetical protein B0H11DRAFT_2194927 [Mycena galericulata]